MELLPNVDGDDLRETLEKNLQFNPDYYRITNVTFPGDEEKLSQEKSSQQIKEEESKEESKEGFFIP